MVFTNRKIRFGFFSRYHIMATLSLLIVSLILSMLAPVTKKVQAAAFSCSAYGILYQYPDGTDTATHHIDLESGSDNVAGTVNNRTINAIGFNVVDNHVYGWDHTQESLVRVHNDHTAENLTITGYTHTSGHQIIIGDVDDNGHYWFINSSNNNWYQVNLNTDPPSLVNSGSAVGPTGTAGADWAFVPGTDSLYRTMDNGGTPGSVSLWAFDRTSKGWSDLGVLTNGSGSNVITGNDKVIGANYADVDEFLYASSNTTGNIWRINVSAVTASFLAQGPSSSSNDGAHCIEASITVSNPVTIQGGSGNPPVCSDQTPSGAPNLFQINRAGTSATLYFTPVSPASYYYIAYGYTPGDERFGAQYNGNSTGAISYTINNLSPYTTYYFKVRAGNGCKPGPWSNEMKTTTTGSVGGSSDLPLPPNTGFGS